jgi:hypothetical protein
MKLESNTLWYYCALILKIKEVYSISIVRKVRFTLGVVMRVVGGSGAASEFGFRLSSLTAVG